MAEENKEYIEELLSNYIDDELTDRERIEVKRLIAGDVDVRRKFEQLRKIKVLLNLTPAAKAPDYIFENVKAQVERKVLLGDYQHSHRKREETGFKHLILRRILTSAAILVLIAMLSWIVMDIVIPPSKTVPPVASNLRAKKKILYEKAPFANHVIKRTIPFYAKLELTTTKAATIDKFISKIILNSDMFDMITSVDRQPNRIRYSINCPRPDVTKLLMHMAPAWNQCENVQLSIPGQTVGTFVTIENLSTTQAMAIFDIDQPQRRAETIKEMAVLNQMIQASEYQKSFAFDTTTPDTLLAPSKPVLTTARRPEAHQPRPQTAELVNLTIIVH